LLARYGHALPARKRRSLEAFVAADRSSFALAWLAGRAARALAGSNETLGTELELARGILWRRLIGVTRRSDASCPPLDAAALGQNRLRRWLSGV
jgi:hypothetical protein